MDGRKINKEEKFEKIVEYDFGLVDNFWKLSIPCIILLIIFLFEIYIVGINQEYYYLVIGNLFSAFANVIGALSLLIIIISFFSGRKVYYRRVKNA
ncbi:MAG: hypothetical protein AABY22_23575 [Nanoarchaeota archaeon]